MTDGWTGLTATVKTVTHIEHAKQVKIKFPRTEDAELMITNGEHRKHNVENFPSWTSDGKIDRPRWTDGWPGLAETDLLTTCALQEKQVETQ